MDIGAVINQQYQVIEHIGRGGMADVWSARDNRLRRMVAIKTIAAGLGAEIDPVSLFKREAHTIAQLEHPHILPIYDFGEHDNSLYIVMRFMTAGSLEDPLREGTMPPEEVLRLGEAIGQALDYAHDNNVIHLDLKPPNILLDSSKSPYLADFGLATALDPEGRARNPGSGTLLYMAPEQFMSDTLDHRADIYSFSIMLFHMFTGRLPFDGTVPLALQQIQRGEEMPFVDDYMAHLPMELTTVLRLGTAQDPNLRLASHMDIMQRIREVLLPSGVSIASHDIQFDGEIDAYNLPTEPYEGISDSDLLEAVDIYSRARYNWQGGQGRFLLGVTHFMLMSEYYQNAEMHGLPIDQQGYQMLLRGALEYDHELEYWWGKVADDDRRWVCLHALRSGNTPARIRALYRLETLPDEEGTGVIPRLVAQALEVETDDTAKIAALTVLGTRARLMKPRPQMQIMTEYRGRLITTMTRLGIEITTSGEWQEVVYSKDVDTLVAEQAFERSPVIAEFAARTVGRMRSLAALAHISKEQQASRAGSLNALALIRDEAPSLPADVVSREARFYAWMTNTVRRLTEKPLDLVLRFSFVFLLGWIALGNHVYSYFRVTVGSLLNARWSNALGLGISFGLILALSFLLSNEIARRLKGFWTWWMRLLVTGTLAYLMGMLAFASFRFLYMQEPAISILWDEMRLAGAGLAFALLASQLLQLKGWQGVILSTLMIFAPIYATYQAYYFRNEFTIIPTSALMLVVGVFCGWRISQLTMPLFATDSNVTGKPNALTQIANNRLVSSLIALGLGLLWAGGNWFYYLRLYAPLLAGESFTWDTVIWIAVINLLIGIVVAYFLPKTRYLFLASGLLCFAGIYAVQGWQFFDFNFAVPFATPSFEVPYYEAVPLLPTTAQPIFNYDSEGLNMIFTTTLPMVIVIALGMHMQELVSGWWNWIGAARTPKDRGGWLSLTLIYVMMTTGLISILALFSAGENRLWELAWSGWAFVTFVMALASYRWAKWGARGLLLSGVVLLIGGIAYDAFIMFTEAQKGNYPTLLEPISLDFWGLGFNAPQTYFWALWLVILGLFIWGALRRALWAGIGIVAMLFGWFILAIASPLQGSMAVFAVSNVALLCYVFLSKYEQMEDGRLSFAALRPSPVQVTGAATLSMETQIFSPSAELPTVEKAVPATQIFSAEELVDSSVPATQKFDMDNFEAAKPAPEMMTEVDPQSLVQASPKNPSNELDTEAKITLDTSALRTQADKPHVRLDTSAIRSDKPAESKIKIDTSAIRSTPPSDSPKLKLDVSEIRNQKTVRFDEPKPKPDDADEEE